MNSHYNGLKELSRNYIEDLEYQVVNATLITVIQETLKFTLMRLDETQRETIQSERNVLRII